MTLVRRCWVYEYPLCEYIISDDTSKALLKVLKLDGFSELSLHRNYVNCASVMTGLESREVSGFKVFAAFENLGGGREYRVDRSAEDIEDWMTGEASNGTTPTPPLTTTGDYEVIGAAFNL
ncbi:hypothetical protein BOTNAR_0024g00440 [Botryotinia narcissicola]|uniref:Uncharacterized protein n=1 Tax=Botryotinia narcissicola TaxID=278944 RepID=A0A4Z1JAJ5_9HELO|nr:hypothetical protein BOTNAR_0024g00440 [Botryotinia narcissicola]